MRNMEKRIQNIDIDSGSGILIPEYDIDTNMVFCPGKGDGNIRFFEYCSGGIYYTNEHKSG